MSSKIFRKGDRVVYIPGHAEGDRRHEDCEKGVVSSVTNHGAFVKYDNSMGIMVTGDEPYTSKLTSFEYLVKINDT